MRPSITSSFCRNIILRSSSRCASTSSTSHTSSSRPPMEPTTFSSKSEPRNIYDRPEARIGMPPEGAGPQWERLKRVGASNRLKGEDGGREGQEAFAGPSRPRMYYDRPQERELPKVANRIPFFIALGLLGIGVWGAFILQATNSERLASSVLRQVNFQLRNSSDVRALLGEQIRLEPNWWGFGEPWISGSINMMQGRVDLKFRIIGKKGAGTVYFTSIRPQQEGAWRIVRYKIIADSGEVLRLEDKVERERII